MSLAPARLLASESPGSMAYALGGTVVLSESARERSLTRNTRYASSKYEMRSPR